MRSIWIAHGNMLPSEVARLAKNKNVQKWTYFGKNYLKLLEYEEKLTGLQRIPIRNFINQSARKIKKAFVNWIGEIGRPSGDSLRWWTSILAEKNTMVSDLFLNFCFIEAIEDIIKDHKESLLIITEDWALGLTLNCVLKQSGFESNVVGSNLKWQILGWSREIIYFAGRWITGTVRLFTQYWAARRTHHLQQPIPLDPGRPRVLIHTCIDEGCLSQDGKFKDRYFTKLPFWLQSQGYDVVTIVWPYNFQRPLKDVFAWFRNNKDCFLIPEDYFRFIDYPKAFMLMLSQLTIRSKVKLFNGRCVGAMLQKEKLCQASRVGTVRFLLYEQMIKRLRENRFIIDYYVDMFENMGSEKPVTKSLHHYYPNAKIIGTQHVPFDPFLLLYAISEDELDYARAVFPDIIASCGDSFFEILSYNGFPQWILKRSPAFRYLHLNSKNIQKHISNSNNDETVLVVLPLELDVAVEILLKVKDALDGLNYKIAIKPHPMMDKNHLLSILGMDELPRFMFWADGDMKTWLSKSTCVLGSATAAIFEAVLYGIPIVVIGRDIGLERNPLAWWQEDEPMFRSLYDSDSIRQVVIEWINLSAQERFNRMKLASIHIKDCFQGWDENLLGEIFTDRSTQN
jgi:hypothetical protein